MADTGKGTQAWHVEYQPSDKGTVAHLQCWQASLLFFCPENVSYFLHKSCFACHLDAPSGMLFNPDIKPTYLICAGLRKYASSVCLVN